MAQNPTVHQRKITLQGAKPPLGRRIQVPSDVSLGFAHEVIQEAFGWEGFYLHRFKDSRDREWGTRAGTTATSAAGTPMRRMLCLARSPVPTGRC
jgi:hypothetical protein